jgi:hypothetical protein
MVCDVACKMRFRNRSLELRHKRIRIHSLVLHRKLTRNHSLVRSVDLSVHIRLHKVIRIHS